MRCTICFSANTKLIQRTCRLVVDKGKVIACYLDDLWLCAACGNCFEPAVAKMMPWHLRARTYRPKPVFRPSVKPYKSEIVRELFGFENTGQEGGEDA